VYFQTSDKSIVEKEYNNDSGGWGDGGFNTGGQQQILGGLAATSWTDSTWNIRVYYCQRGQDGDTDGVKERIWDGSNWKDGSYVNDLPMSGGYSLAAIRVSDNDVRVYYQDNSTPSLIIYEWRPSVDNGWEVTASS
jgi:hypothetical protein